MNTVLSVEFAEGELLILQPIGQGLMDLEPEQPEVAKLHHGKQYNGKLFIWKHCSWRIIAVSISYFNSVAKVAVVALYLYTNYRVYNTVF